MSFLSKKWSWNDKKIPSDWQRRVKRRFWVWIAPSIYRACPKRKFHWAVSDRWFRPPESPSARRFRKGRAKPVEICATAVPGRPSSWFPQRSIWAANSSARAGTIRVDRWTAGRLSDGRGNSTIAGISGWCPISWDASRAGTAICNRVQSLESRLRPIEIRGWCSSRGCSTGRADKSWAVPEFPAAEVSFLQIKIK